MTVYKFDSIAVNYHLKHLHEIMGVATDGEFKFGEYFPISVKHRQFELQLYFIEWEDSTMEIHPRVLKGQENMQTLHGRLRLSIRNVAGGKYKGHHIFTLKQAKLKDGVTLHSNLFGTNPDSLDDVTGFDTVATLEAFGATAVGTKYQLLGDDGPKRNEYCCICKKGVLDPAIAAFVLTRIIPLHKHSYA